MLNYFDSLSESVSFKRSPTQLAVSLDTPDKRRIYFLTRLDDTSDTITSVQFTIKNGAHNVASRFVLSDHQYYVPPSLSFSIWNGVEKQNIELDQSQKDRIILPFLSPFSILKFNLPIQIQPSEPLNCRIDHATLDSTLWQDALDLEGASQFKIQHFIIHRPR